MKHQLRASGVMSRDVLGGRRPREGLPEEKPWGHTHSAARRNGPAEERKPFTIHKQVLFSKPRSLRESAPVFCDEADAGTLFHNFLLGLKYQCVIWASN